MPFVVIPNVLAADELIASAGLNANFNALANTINGNIDTTNINATDGINISVLTGFSAVLAVPGQLTLPGGLILQWGTVSCPGNGAASEAVVFTNPFPTGIFVVMVSVDNAYQANPQKIGAQYDTPTITGFNATAYGASTSAAITVAWVALGH